MSLARRSLLAAAAAFTPGATLGQTRLILTASHGLQGWTALRDRLSAALASAHPNLALTWQPGSDDWDVTLQSTLRQGIVDALPDLSHQALNNVRVLAERGLVVPLDPFIAASGGWEKVGYLPTLQQTSMLGGSTYAVPFATTIPVIYYNMTLARAAGFTGDVLPADWPGVLDLARRINALGSGTMGLFVEYDATSAWIFQSLVESFGGHMMSPDEREVTFDGTEGKQAMELTREFGLAGHRDMLNGQARQSFAAGRTGIHIRSASGVKPVKDAAAGQFELRIGNFPIPTANGRLPGAGNGLVMMTRDPARQRAAWDYFILATAGVGQTAIAETSGYLPANIRSVSDPTGLGAFYAANPDYRVVVDRLPVVTDWYAFPGNNSVRIFKMIIDEQRSVVTGQAKPEEALTRMAARTRQILREG